MDRAPDADHEESPAERLEREHSQLFNEVRAVLPGVEVLFAFLLTVAFTNRFERFGSFERDLYMVVLLATATAQVLLIGPAAFHRIRFRQRDKEALMRVANREALLALAALTVAVVGAFHLVASMVLSSGLAVAITSLLGGLALTVWWVVPLRRRLSNPGDAGDTV